jgi:hypothetical protein
MFEIAIYVNESCENSISARSLIEIKYFKSKIKKEYIKGI